MSPKNTTPKKTDQKKTDQKKSVAKTAQKKTPKKNSSHSQAIDTFPKSYDHKHETARYQQRNKAWLFEPKTVQDLQAKLRPDLPRGEHYSLAIPPPNVTGVLHAGHALMATVEDTLIRHARMNGYKTVWIPGTDHAAISTQVVVQNKLKKEKNLTRFDLGRTEFLKQVRDRTTEHRDTITSQIQQL